MKIITGKYFFQVQRLTWGKRRISKHRFGGAGGHGTMFVVFGTAFSFGIIEL